jgi:hypothetical protein
MIDIRGLPAGAQLTAADFAFAVSAAVRSLSSQPPQPQPWRPAPAPSGITVRRGAGVDGSDRVTLVWPDGTFQNAWLRVTVNATANTGLVQPDVSYIGNLVGDANGDGSVTVNDYRATVGALFSASPLSGAFDFDRDGRVGLADLRAVRANLFRRLPNIFTPAQPVPLIERPNTRIESTSLPPAVGGGGNALLAGSVRTQVLDGDVRSALA